MTFAAADGAALIEQAVTIDDNAGPVLASEAEHLTDSLQRSLVVSIDRMARAGGDGR